jgi:hypothetical protein
LFVRKIKPFEDNIGELTKSLEFLSSKFDELFANSNVVEASNKSLQQENQLLRSQVSNLENTTAQISSNLNDLDQYIRRDTLEIKGIAVQRDDNTDDLVCSVAALVNVHMQPEDITISHRLKVPRDANTPPTIIVKFVQRSLRDKLYFAKKYLRDKSTSDLNIWQSATNKIFVSENLTPKNNLLFKKCLAVKKSKNYRFIWTQYGKIYLRKNSNSSAILISKAEDLDNLP